MGGESQIGTNTTYTKHSFISNEGIRLPASSAPQRRVPYDCQIPLHAIYIIIQSAVYRTRMGGFLFDVSRLVLILKIILYPREKKITALQYVTGYSMRSAVGGFGTFAVPLRVPQIQVNSGISGKL